MRQFPQRPEFNSFQELVAWYDKHRLTPCRQYPEACQNREIVHVVLDADDTIWETRPFGLAGNCPLPLKKQTEEVFTARDEFDIRHTITLKPDVLQTVDALTKRGIGVSIASHNPDHSIDRVLRSMGLRDRFDYVVSTYHFDKDEILAAIAQKKDIPTENVLFVDDSIANAEAVAEGTAAMAVVMGIDIKELSDIIGIIDHKGLEHA